MPILSVGERAFTDVDENIPVMESQKGLHAFWKSGVCSVGS